MKQRIRLTEGDIARMVQGVLMEMKSEGKIRGLKYPTVKSAYDKMKSLGQDRRARELQDNFNDTYGQSEKVDYSNWDYENEPASVSFDLGNDTMTFGVPSKDGGYKHKTLHRDPDDDDFGQQTLRTPKRSEARRRAEYDDYFRPENTSSAIPTKNNYIAEGRIKLTENDLRRIVKESVKSALKGNDSI